MSDLDTRIAEADVDPSDNDLFGQRDARVWAERFVLRATANPAIPTDEGTMLAWFAGAIETGYDLARAAFAPEQTKEASA